MALRDEQRRPLLLVLLVVLPVYVIARSVAITEATPQPVVLPAGEVIGSTMRDIHGAVMAGSVIAFVCGLVGVFVMQAAFQADQRLVIAGMRPGQVIAARLAVVLAASILVVSVSALATAVYFDPRSWLPFLSGLAFVGLIYAGLGALAGAVFDKLAATYLLLFLAMTDLLIVQNPMFGDGDPASWATLLPGYGPSQLMIVGAFSNSFRATGELVLSLAWLTVVTGAALFVLRRAVAPEREHLEIKQ